VRRIGQVQKAVGSFPSLFVKHKTKAGMAESDKAREKGETKIHTQTMRNPQPISLLKQDETAMFTALSHSSLRE
jgi:hypothetical protein